MVSQTGGPLVECGLTAHPVLPFDSLEAQCLAYGVTDGFSLFLESNFAHQAFVVTLDRGVHCLPLSRLIQYQTSASTIQSATVTISLKSCILPRTTK